jgi:hypothetical protein
VPTVQALYADRVAETTATTGTGTLTLGGALQDFQSFNSAFPTNQRVYYTIQGGVDWEVGTGVFTSPSTLTREIVFSSSNAGALVNLPAGGHTVFCDFPAQAIADIGLTLALRQVITPR